MAEMQVSRKGFRLGMLDTHRRSHSYQGKTLYQLMICIERDGYTAKFPDRTQMARLARVYLDSEYEEPEDRDVQSFTFLIAAHIPREYRELFLGEVAKETHLTLKECPRQK